MYDSVQLAFPFHERASKLAGRKVWIVASDTLFHLSDRHSYLFLDPDSGTGRMDGTDLLLVRGQLGSFELFAARDPGGPTETEALRRLVERHLHDLGSRSSAMVSEIEELIAVSFKPGRFRGWSEQAQRRRETARTDFEEALFRLAMVPWGQGQPRTIAGLASKLGPDAHPVVRTLLRREMADALAAAYGATSDEAYAVQALPSYRLAAWEFAEFGLRHQWRTTRDNAADCELALNEPDLPGLPSNRAANRTTIGFSVDRLCGARLSLDEDERPHAPATLLGPRQFKSLGKIEVSDSSVATVLGARRSPSRRLAATVRMDESGLVVTAGVFDEMRALLRVGMDSEPQNGVEAIIVASDTIDFSQRLWALHPDRPVPFSGKCQSRRRHLIDIRATMPKGNGLALQIEVATNRPSVQYFI